MTKTSPANSPRQKYVSKICGNLESIKKQPKSVNFYNALIVKGLYFDISDCFWLFYASKYYIKPQLLTMLCFSILSCILFKNYIKPQLAEATGDFRDSCILFKNYIKPQLAEATGDFRDSCILFKNYIKPQQLVNSADTIKSCILFKNYIKPQQARRSGAVMAGCILFKNYIKPQPRCWTPDARSVVSYLKTTSNHNATAEQGCRPAVVSYLKTTSNHNVDSVLPASYELYLI